jgi:CBS domain-containing protein
VLLVPRGLSGHRTLNRLRGNLAPPVRAPFLAARTVHAPDDMNAIELMSKNPVTIDERTSIARAVELLQTLEIRHLPVVSRTTGALIGMLSDRDIRQSGTPFTILSDPRLENVPITELMSADAITIDPEADVSEIIDRMLEHRVGALPVVDETTDELLGIVSYVDVLRGVRDIV